MPYCASCWPVAAARLLSMSKKLMRCSDCNERVALLVHSYTPPERVVEQRGGWGGSYGKPMLADPVVHYECLKCGGRYAHATYPLTSAELEKHGYVSE